MNQSDPTPKLASTGLGSFTTSFWMLNIMEMWERLAYYGMRLVVPIYIMQADEVNGLHFSADEKGTIYALWAVVQSLLPMFTGGYADRYGYKPTIAVSITIKIIGYVMMGALRSFWGFTAGALVLAAGTALFKPGIQGSLAQNMRKENSSLGWGLFYQVVNVGAFLGPFLAHSLKEHGWPWVFYGCAGIVALNYLMLFTYRETPSGADSSLGFMEVFSMTMSNISPLIYRGGQFVWQLRLPALILILAGFWMMMYQIWDLHPNFVVDWVDSTQVAKWLELLPDAVRNRMIEVTDRGVQVSQEHILNLNAFMVMLFVSVVGYAVSNVRRLTCMLAGMMMATCGVLVAGWTTSGFVFLVGIMFFSFGEMLTGPKKNEYFALIAPEGKKALYLGYVNIPIAIGAGIGSKVGGWAYGRFGEKAVLAQKYIAEHTEQGLAKAWDGSVATLESTLNISRADSFKELQAMLDMNASEATELLWNMYHPHYVWIPFAAVGVVSGTALYVFGRMSRNWADMDV
jgi:proton-dependent oligopeptide transporter, POT family